jgi:sulfur carrier protein
VVVNGSTRALSPGATVADLVSSWCASPEGIAVARNREIVPRSEWATTALSPRDVVEIVTAAAGG